MFEYLQFQILDALQRRKDEGKFFVRQEVLSACNRDESVMAVTPFTREPIVPEKLSLIEIPVMNLDGKLVQGICSPDPEYRLHLALYHRYSKMRALVHVQSGAVVAFSQLGKALPVMGRCHAESFPRTLFCTDEACAEGDYGALYRLMDMQADDEEGCAFLKGDGALIWAQTAEIVARRAAALEMICAMVVQNTVDVPEMEQELARGYYLEARQREQYFNELHPIAGNLVTEEESRIISINLLRYLDKVCRENDVKYSITGGTLLGAVRHRGFIPWDDDVDVFLTRPEYEKLLACFPKDGTYRLYNRQTEEGYVYVWSRLIDTRTMIEKSPNCAALGKGLFLDVCVVDGLPRLKILRSLHMAHLRVLYRLRRCCIQKPGTKRYNEKGALFVFMKKIVNLLSNIEYWNRRIEKVMQRYPFDRSEYVGNFVSSGYGKRELLHKSVFDSYSDMEFEGIKTMVCDGYEEYLNNIYGDYMMLPEFEKRRGHHPAEAYWI